MSAAGTKLSKKSAAKPTIEVHSGTDGRTPIAATIAQVAQAREEKLKKARAAVALDAEQLAALPVAKPRAKKIPATLNLMPTPKASRVQPAGTAVAKLAAKAAKVAAVKRAAATNGSVPVAPAGMKYCKRHQTFHPVADFASNSAAKDGLYYICRKAEAEVRAAKKAAATA